MLTPNYLYCETVQSKSRLCQDLHKHPRFPDGMEFVGVSVQPNILVERTIEDSARGTDLSRGVLGVEMPVEFYLSIAAMLFGVAVVVCVFYFGHKIY